MPAPARRSSGSSACCKRSRPIARRERDEGGLPVKTSAPWRLEPTARLRGCGRVPCRLGMAGHVFRGGTALPERDARVGGWGAVPRVNADVCFLSLPGCKALLALCHGGGLPVVAGGAGNMQICFEVKLWLPEESPPRLT